jgi:tetratricopeptide (TPR) repeat protein
MVSNVPIKARQSLLGVICSAQTHLTIGDLAYALGKSVDACREILQPYLGFVNIQGGIVSIFHDTLRNWLLSSGALEYQIDITDGHRRLYQLLCHDNHERPRCSYPLKNIFLHAEQSASLDYIFGAIPGCRPLFEALLQFIADHAADYLHNGTNRRIFKAIGMIEITDLHPGCAVQLLQCLYVTSCLPLCEQIGESFFRTQNVNEDILGLIALTKLELGKHRDAVAIASRMRDQRPVSEYKPPSDYVVALAYHEAGRYEKECRLLQRILINREKLHPRWVAKALHQLGSAYSRSGSYTKAKDFYLRARAVAEPLGYVKDQALIEHELGRLLHYVGETKDALGAFTRELTLLGRNMNLRDYSYALYEKGKLFNNYGRFEDARSMLSEGLDIFTSIEDRRGQVLMTREIAIGHYQSGNIDLGLSLLLNSTEIAYDIGYERGSFFSKIYSAECYIQLGMGDHAHRVLFEAKRSGLYGNDMFARSCWSRAAGLVAIQEGKIRVARKMLKEYGTIAQSIGYERGLIYSQLYQVIFGLTKMSDRQRTSLMARIEQYNDKRAINLFASMDKL